MIVFENDGEIDPRLAMLIGVNVKDSASGGIAVQKPDKPSLYTYDITEHLYLTEDRTAGFWSTDPIIARGLTLIEDKRLIDETLTAPADSLESRLDYDYARDPSDTWIERAEVAVARDR